MATELPETRYQDPKTDPWLRLAFLGEKEKLREALDSGVLSVDYFRPTEFTNKDSLMIAAALGRQHDIIKMLKLRDPDPNYRNTRMMTVLHIASAMGDIPTLGVLANWDRVDWNVQDELGWSAYHHAVYTDREDSIILLNSVGKTDPGLVDRDGLTATRMAEQMKRSYSLAMRTNQQK